MGWIGERVESIMSIVQIRQSFAQAITLVNLLLLLFSLKAWNLAFNGFHLDICYFPYPIVGDILFLHMNKDPIRTGEIVVFNVEGRPIPIVHRVIQVAGINRVHERRDIGEVDVLTKGDNNDKNDRVLYAPGQKWLQRHHIVGRAVGFLPYVGWVTIIMTEKPLVKYVVIGALGLLLVTSKD